MSDTRVEELLDELIMHAAKYQCEPCINELKANVLAEVSGLRERLAEDNLQAAQECVRLVKRAEAAAADLEKARKALHDIATGYRKVTERNEDVIERLMKIAQRALTSPGPQIPTTFNIENAPSCHVCGGVMEKRIDIDTGRTYWRCMDCGSTTRCEPASTPEGESE